MLPCRRADRLPAELLDMILGDVGLATLKACTLVCHNWLETSRRHLFWVVVVRPEDESFDDFIKFVKVVFIVSHVSLRSIANRKDRAIRGGIPVS